MTNISRSINQKLATLSGVLLALLLSLTGCQKERFVTEEDLDYRHTAEFDEGSTYMSLALRGSNPPASSQPQTEDQSGGNYQVTWQGDDIIENFAVFIVSNGENKVTCIAGKVTDDKVVEKWDPAKQELLLKPFRSAPVNKQVFAFFNIPQQYLTYLGEKLDDPAAFLERIAEPIPYIGASGITYGSQDAPTLEAFRPDSHIATKTLVTATGVAAKNESERVPLRQLNNVEAGSAAFYTDIALSFFDRYHFQGVKSNSIPLYKRADRILSSGVKSYTPEDNITEDQVTNGGRNLAQVYTRRVLAQAVVSADGTLVGKNLPQMKNMRLEGLSFQVFNFEPTFYPIAKTSDKQWPGNKNTISPRYDNTDGATLINFSTYQPTIKIGGKEEKFDAESLVRDRFFRSSHFLLDDELTAALDPADKDFAQLLLRQADLTTGQQLDLQTVAGTAPVANTTFWGGCYVTETTHKWATDASSGYNTANTPFFAVVAFFDANELPWSVATQSALADRKAARKGDFEESVKDLKKQIAEKQAALDKLIAESGGGSSDPWAAAQAKFQEWVDYCTSVLGPTTLKTDRDRINNFRKDYVAGTIANRAEFDKKVRRNYSKVNNVVARSGADASKKETDLWAEVKRLDEEREKNPNQGKINELSAELKQLRAELKAKEEAFNSSDEWYKTGDTSVKNTYTPSFYEQGINRIFYSLVDEKFYLNYHEIPMANRGGVTHTLAEGDAWLTELKSKLPNGKNFPTLDNGAPADAAVLPPREVLPKLSQLMNGTIKEIDLSPAERRSMDFYLYGRVAPGLVQYFGGSDRTDPMDLHTGYVAWYTANTKDQVVSYPCYIRYREEKRLGISRPRLMMVYYAWLNPNTQDSSNTYASPVLRNNIYHMHINGFTRMGLSAIPFVPRQSEDSPYYFLHGAFDPDEQVPTLGAALNATGGTGSPTSLSTPRSTSFSLTF